MQPVGGYLQEKVARLLGIGHNEILRVGLAIEEALMNAIYHGNLEVGSELKESEGGRFHQLASQRKLQEPYAKRRVHVVGQVSSREFICTIRDEGNGFEVASIPDPLAPENLHKASGRGLFFIRQFMDQTEHNESGNVITMVKRVNICT